MGPSPHAPLLQPQPQPMATVPYREGGAGDGRRLGSSLPATRTPAIERREAAAAGCDHLSSESPTSPTPPTSPPWQQHAQHAPSQATTATPRPLDAFLRPFPRPLRNALIRSCHYECERRVTCFTDIAALARVAAKRFGPSCDLRAGSPGRQPSKPTYERAPACSS